MKKRATLKHIADSLNLSVSTVSRILNGRGEFSDETRESVLRVSKMLDYRANSLAVSLRKQSSDKLVGVILPEVRHYFFSSILNGVMSACHEQGYMVMVGESRHNPSQESDLIDKFADFYVSGLIVCPSKNMSSIENIKRLESQPLPFVVIDRTYSDSNCSYVKHDDYNGAYIAVRHLIEKGYRRISIITGAKDCVISQSRAEGYINALKEHGIPLQENLIRSSSQANKDEGYRLFKDLWEKEATDAVFAITDMLASGVYEYAHEKGISIPNDLGVVGYSNSDIAEVLYPKLTSVQQNGDEMGKTSLMFLLNQIASEVKIQHKVFESDLVIRASTRKDSTAKQ